MSKANSSAPRKTKLDGSPTWDQLNAPFRYDLTDPDVYYAVAGLATQLNVSNISIVAAQLLDFAMTMSDQGQVGWAVRAKPTPDHLRLQLKWEKASNWPQEVKLDMERKERQRKLAASARQRTPFGFRWGRERHNRIKFLAGEYGCSLGQMVTLLLAYALNEYRAGHLKLELLPVASGDGKAG